MARLAAAGGKRMRKLLLWIVWNIPLGILAPWVLGGCDKTDAEGGVC